MVQIEAFFDQPVNYVYMTFSDCVVEWRLIE